ncbi:MAG: zf-HC2 domain-containing protein, partial [Dietzia sp.]|nr:zf-HC2 domain-containing protein [Dietzia sp.]
MDRHQAGRGSTPEYRLSRDSVREVAESTPLPRGGRHFLSTDHLSTEAAAAYVDGCLPASGKVRADAHLAQCPQCRREVTEQQDARRAL